MREEIAAAPSLQLAANQPWSGDHAVTREATHGHGMDTVHAGYVVDVE